MRVGRQIDRVAIRTSLFQDKKTGYGVHPRQLLIGFSILVLGALFYSFLRSAGHTYFLKFLVVNPQSTEFLSPVFVTLGNSLPTFIPVSAFSLLTAGLVARNCFLDRRFDGLDLLSIAG